MLPVRVQPEPELRRARLGRAPRASSRTAGLRRPRTAAEGSGRKAVRLPDPGGTRGDVQEDRSAGHDANQPRRGVRHRLGTARLPGPDQDGVSGRRTAPGVRPLHRAGERPERRLRRLERSAASAVSIVYTPEAMRFRGMSVLTNTPPRGPSAVRVRTRSRSRWSPCSTRRRGSWHRPVRDPTDQRARITIRRYGGDRGPVITSAYMRRSAGQRGREVRLERAKRARSGQRRGSKVIGVGIGQAFHSAGSNGFDGLVRLSPEGRASHPHRRRQPGHLLLRVHLAGRGRGSQVRRLGELRHRAWRLEPRAALELRAVRQQHVVHDDAHELRRGRWTRVAKLKEIAATDLGGSPDDYDIGDETVFRRGNPSRRLTYAAAETRHRARAAKFSGEEAPRT